MSDNIRDAREAKNLSEDKVAQAAGLSYNVFVRIQEGSGRTTPEEVRHVLDVIRGMEPGTRKLAGRPFKDAEIQEAVNKARAEGTSVSAAIEAVKAKRAGNTTEDDGPEGETPKQRKNRLAREKRNADKQAAAAAEVAGNQDGLAGLTSLLP